MNAYESYIDTQLPWISQIPSHWSLLRNKNFLQEVKETVGDNFAEFTLLSLTTKGIIPRDISSGKGKFPKDFDTYKIVKSGDMVFCLFDIDETPRTVGLSAHDGMLTGAYAVFHVSGINSRFLYYYYLSLDEVKALRPLYSGLRKTIKTNVFLGTELPTPPREEQDQIVRYLDWQVSKINKLISARKKQIVLLKEQKQAVINEAVTKGLDPAVPMKDSGVEWIGEIPAEWSLVPLYSIAKVISMTNKEDEELLSVYLDEGVIPFSQKEEKRTNPTSKDLSKYQYVRYGNLVLNNQQAWRGSVGVSKFEGIVSPAYIILELSKCLNTDYANLLFRGKNMVYQYGLASKGVGSIQRNLYWPHLKRAFVLLPPIPIQKEIVRYIVKRCAKIDALISNIHSEIALLVEYRTRLISDVVTGQIDVRDIEVPEFEYIADDVDDVSDDENTDLEEIMEEEE
jgi:type I restriction enzyme S subunit